MLTTGPAQLGITALVLLLFGNRFLAWERQGRGVRTVLTIWWVTLIDASLFPDVAASLRTSFFHPVVFGQNFRLLELLVPLALVLRLHVRGWPRRLDATAPVWLAFYAFTALATVTGFLQHYSGGLVLTEASILFYVGATTALVGSVPVRDYLRERTLTPFVRWTAGAALVLFVLNELDLRITTTAIPNLPLDRFGLFGPDAASLYPVIGLIGILTELTRTGGRRRRATVLAPAAFLVLSHLGTTQRAARLDLYLAVVVVAVACLSPLRRRLRVTRAQVGISALAVVALVLLAPAFVESVSAAFEGRQAHVSVPFAEQTSKALDTGRRQGSIQSRYNQWDAILTLIREKPFSGWGLGRTYEHYEVGFGPQTQGITHNLVLDVLFRLGLVGLALWVVGTVRLIAGGFGAWRRLLDDRVAAFGLALAAATTGLLARGMVESIFEKYKLAVGLGILYGLLVSVRAALRTQDEGHEPGDGQQDDERAREALVRERLAREALPTGRAPAGAAAPVAAGDLVSGPAGAHAAPAG